MRRVKRILCALVLFTAIFSLNAISASAEETSLKSIDIKTEELFQGEKLYYDIDYTGEVKFVAIWAKEITTGEVFYISTSNPSNGYFDLAEKNGNTHNGVGTFQLNGLTLGINNGIIFYSTSGCAEKESSDCIKYDFGDIRFTIKEKEQEKPNDDLGIFDYVMNIDEQQVYTGEKVNVSLGSPESFNGIKIDEKPLSSVMLSFTNQNTGEILNTYLSSLGNEPYFIVPSTATVGKYSINYGYLTFTDGTSERYQNRPGKVFSYGGSFTVKEKELDKDNYTFSSDRYDRNVKADLEKLNNDAIITINANNSPIIDKELFELIKSTDRTLIIDYQNIRWVFNGRDIIEPKAIEVSVKLEEFLAENTSNLKDIITTKSALLEFTNNGDLPGKALIKINSEDVEKYFDSEVLYVYYFDESNDNIFKVAMEVQKNDGFFEFYINHNSKYILTSKEIDKVGLEDDSKTGNNTEEKDDSLGENIILYAGIGLGALIVIIVVSILIVKNRNKNKLTNSVINEDAVNDEIKSPNGESDNNSEPTPLA